MKKQKFINLLSVAAIGAALVGSVAYADETPVTDNSTAPVVSTTTPTEVSTPVTDGSENTSQPTETPVENTETSAPSSETTPVVPSDGNAVVTEGDKGNSSEETTPGTETTGNTTDKSDSETKPVENNNSETPEKETGKSETPANQNTAGQTGSISTVTGQVIRDVTTSNPVELDNGAVITDVQNGVATLSDGSKTSLTDLGAQKNADNTYTVKTKDGKMETLPETGEESGLLASLSGLALMALSALGYKKVN